jgi:hypothetical protein
MKYSSISECELCTSLEAKEICGHQWKKGSIEYQCTRAVGHVGDHVACGVSTHDIAHTQQAEAMTSSIEQRAREAAKAIEGLCYPSKISDIQAIIADALQAQHAEDVAAGEKVASKLNWLIANCKIVYWPGNGAYPIEHNPHANKDGMVWLDAAISATQPAQP